MTSQTAAPPRIERAAVAARWLTAAAAVLVTAASAVGLWAAGLYTDGLFGAQLNTALLAHVAIFTAPYRSRGSPASRSPAAITGEPDHTPLPVGR